MKFEFEAIARVHSPYVEKFGVPRQPGLVPAARAEIELLPPYNDPACVDGLETCSHIWLQFVFDQSLDTQWRPKVRPPRLGGNQSLGVFATRSPVRPNPIGLSVVKLEGIDSENGLRLMVSGLDLVDGTPILDIKPYVPYVDAVADAQNQFAVAEPELLGVIFSPEAERFCQQHNGALQALITQVLQQDPRPAYHKNKDEGRRYGLSLKPQIDGAV
ncbi:MAG: tRNA (N6-threonylcarbamoyladenosine(37)-N6)-methyltransferase TrmO, partial [Cellvibrionaceae bacterium]|nr:tRNA (N6-threonylcarbamoyladenosine(37)-N6)-methyltransferase TrmO [Cellvibrionaceae bacterium]